MTKSMKLRTTHPTLGGPVHTAVRLTAALILSAFAATSPLEAQDPLGGPDPIGVREPAQLLDRFPKLQVLSASAAATKNSVVLVPSFSNSASGDAFGATIAYVNRTWFGLPIQLRGGGRRLESAGVERTRVSFDVKTTLAPTASAWKASASVAFQSTTESGARQDASLILERALRSDCTESCLVFAVTGSFVRLEPDAGPSTDGTVVAPGLILRLGSTTEIAADYRFETDVLGDADHSLSLRQALATLPGSPTVSMTVGRARAVSLGLVLVW